MYPKVQQYRYFGMIAGARVSPAFSVPVEIPEYLFAAVLSKAGRLGATIQQSRKREVHWLRRKYIITRVFIGAFVACLGHS